MPDTPAREGLSDLELQSAHAAALLAFARAEGLTDAHAQNMWTDTREIPKWRRHFADAIIAADRAREARATPARFEGYTLVRDDAVDWLKKHYPALCEKSGLCERIGGRLYTRSALASTTPPASEARATGSFQSPMDGRTIPLGLASAPAAPPATPVAASEALRRGSLVEAVAKAIVFEDCGSTDDWQDNTNLAEAAIRVCDARNPPRCSYCHASTSAALSRGGDREDAERPLWLRDTPEGRAERERMEWKFIAHTLSECRKLIEADGSRQSWIDPAENIAKERAARQAGKGA